MQFVSNQIRSLDMKSIHCDFRQSWRKRGQRAVQFQRQWILPFCWFLVYAAVDAVKCAKQSLQRSFLMVGNLLYKVHTAKTMSSAAEDRFKSLVITDLLRRTLFTLHSHTMMMIQILKLQFTWSSRSTQPQKHVVEFRIFKSTCWPDDHWDQLGPKNTVESSEF